VVTSFLFLAQPVGTVYAGPIFWEATHAKAVMRAYRDFLPTAPARCQRTSEFDNTRIYLERSG
jgi:hypothetical protein